MNALKNAEDQKRDELYVKLYAFYEEHDKSKLQGVPKLVDYAMYNGVEALNEKLYMKYNAGISTERYVCVVLIVIVLIPL